MNSGIWTAAALAVATAGLAGCGEAAPPAPSGPATPDGITVSDARLALPPVKGNPGALYFTVANSAQKTWMIRKVEVAGAGSTMMHQMGTWNKQPSMDEISQLPVPAGQTVKLEPGGTHVMAMYLAETLTPGSKAEATITFVGGTTVKVPAEVIAAGDAR